MTEAEKLAASPFFRDPSPFRDQSLIFNGLDRPWDADSGRQLNVRLILEQKGTKETKEDPIPFSFVVSGSLELRP